MVASVVGCRKRCPSSHSVVHGGWVAMQQHRAGKKKCPLETPYFQHMKADGPKQRNQLHKAIDHKVKWHGCQGTYCVQI